MTMPVVTFTTSGKVKKKKTMELEVPGSIAKGDYIVTVTISGEANDIQLLDGRIPVRLSENPDALALAGIWKGRNLSKEELRRIAWGGRA